MLIWHKRPKMMERMLPKIEAIVDTKVILRKSPAMSRLQLELHEDVSNS